MRVGRSWVLALGAVGVAGCAAPAVTSDGQLVFTAGASRGAVVLTANGVEIHDTTELPPTPTPRASPYEPWQPTTGFLLPASNVWRRTSRAFEAHEGGVDASVRASDELVASWGADAFLHVEIGAHAEAPRRSVVVVIDDDDAERANETLDLVIARLRADDDLTVVDARGARIVVPAVRAAEGTLAEASLASRFTKRSGKRRDLAQAIRTGRQLVGGKPSAVVLASDRAPTDADAELASLVADGVPIVARAPSRGDRLVASCGARTADDKRAFDEAMNRALGAIPAVVMRDATLRIESAPAPTRILEASNGVVESTLDDDAIHLGDVRRGEGRAEVLRVALPRFVPNELLVLRFHVTFVDEATGETRSIPGSLPLRYSDDVGVLAEERNADVIADASAMALVGRVSREGVGSTSAFDGIFRVIDVTKRSLARAPGDERRIGAERRVLEALADE